MTRHFFLPTIAKIETLSSYQNNLRGQEHASTSVVKRSFVGRRRFLWRAVRAALLGHAVSEEKLRAYASGSDVMATWSRCTGWIPPSKDPRYIKKWLDFQLEVLDSRRRAIEQQFAMQLVEASNEIGDAAKDGNSSATHIDPCRDDICTRLQPTAQLASSRRCNENDTRIDAEKSVNPVSTFVAEALDRVSKFSNE